ncbi:MAG: hypothetical protein ABIJ94_03880 [candidate division WOR-3 bacterium]
MTFIAYFLGAMIFLLTDLSFAPYLFRPIFFISIAAIGPFIIKRDWYFFLAVILSFFVYLIVAFDQALKLLFICLIILLFHSIIHKKNALAIIFLATFFSTAVLVSNNLIMFMVDFFLTWGLALCLYKISLIFNFQIK